jgi:hypothetical protein
MAHAVNFPGTNKTFTAPEGREDVSDLHVFSNGVCNVSAWELTDEELEEVVRTRRVYLSVMSGPVFYPSFLGSEGQVRSLVVDYGKVWQREEKPRGA